MSEKRRRTDLRRRELAQAIADPVSLGWAALGVAGIVLGVASLGGPVSHGADSPPVRLVAHVPDPFMALALGSGGLAVALVLWLLVPRIRRRTPDDEALELDHESARLPWWAVVILRLIELLPLAALAYLLWHGATRLDGTVRDVISRALSLLARSRELASATGAPAASSPMWSATVTFLALAAALGSLALVLWILVGDRLARWWAGPFSESPRHALVHVVDESLEELARELDPRIAIIKCYRRFEYVLARSRLPRAPWQTPSEFMREALGRLALPEEPVRTMTELFELARFSNDALTERDRLSALDALGQTRSALEREASDVSAPA
jgi:hypothetical protein